MRADSRCRFSTKAWYPSTRRRSLSGSRPALRAPRTAYGSGDPRPGRRASRPGSPSLGGAWRSPDRPPARVCTRRSPRGCRRSRSRTAGREGSAGRLPGFASPPSQTREPGPRRRCCRATPAGRTPQDAPPSPVSPPSSPRTDRVPRLRKATAAAPARAPALGSPGPAPCAGSPGRSRPAPPSFARPRAPPRAPPGPATRAHPAKPGRGGAPDPGRRVLSTAQAPWRAAARRRRAMGRRSGSRDPRPRSSSAPCARRRLPQRCAGAGRRPVPSLPGAPRPSPQRSGGTGSADGLGDGPSPVVAGSRDPTHPSPPVRAPPLRRPWDDPRGPAPASAAPGAASSGISGTSRMGGPRAFRAPFSSGKGRSAVSIW